MNRSANRTLAAALVLPLLASGASAQIEGPSRTTHVLRAGTSVVVGATVAQLTRYPAVWERTAEGFGSRLAEQSGSLALRSLALHGLHRALPWHADTTPCNPGARSIARCALMKTLIVRTASGAPRPDVARVGSLLAASVAPMLWRPGRVSERVTGGEVLVRVGSGLAFEALRRAVVAGRRTTVPH